MNIETCRRYLFQKVWRRDYLQCGIEYDSVSEFTSNEDDDEDEDDGSKDDGIGIATLVRLVAVLCNGKCRKMD